MKVFRNFSRIIIAPIFIFSGFVKAIDPLGFTYKLTDYFEAFGMDFLSPLALVLAVTVCTIELVIGLNLLMGILMRITSTALLVFMSFFTILTLIVAISNPVTDCGCFGDALVITNWQTFWKNIIFLLPTLVVFYGRKRFEPITSMAGELGITILFVLTGVLLSVYTYRNLPVIDFRPYKIGTHIPSSMVIPEGAPLDEYETIFIYAKDGVEKEFAVDAIPYTDTNWKYVDRKTTLIKKGYEPPIHDFTISTHSGQDITDSVLNNSAYTLLVIDYDLERADLDGLEAINELVEKTNEIGVMTYGLSSSTRETVSKVLNDMSMNFNFHTTDEITLKTIVRSNPGLVLLKDGVVVDKWHYNNLPDPETVKDNILSIALEHQQKIKKATTIGFYLMFLVALFTILILIVKTND